MIKQPVFKNSKVEKIVPEFCVDTCILIELYAYYKNNIRHINYITNKETYSNYHIKFLKLLKAKKINLYVPNEVLFEFYKQKHFYDFENKKRFLEEMGFKRIFFENTSKEFYFNFFYIKNKLVNLYRQSFNEKDKENILNNEFYNITNKDVLNSPAFNKKSKTDAKIMAVSAFLGLPLITVNKNHFITKNRPQMILYLNRKIEGVSHSQKATPVLPSQVFKMLENGIYPLISPEIKKEINSKNYPIHNFAFCRKKALNKKLLKQNKKIKKQQAQEYFNNQKNNNKTL